MRGIFDERPLLSLVQTTTEYRWKALKYLKWIWRMNWCSFLFGEFETACQSELAGKIAWRHLLFSPLRSETSKNMNILDDYFIEELYQGLKITNPASQHPRNNRNIKCNTVWEICIYYNGQIAFCRTITVTMTLTRDMQRSFSLLLRADVEWEACDVL